MTNTWVRLSLVAVVFVALTGSAAEAQEVSPSFNAMSGVVLGAHVADLVTTVRALDRPGTREGNPLLRPFAGSSAGLSAVKLGGAALSTWAKREVYKSNPKLAWWLAIGEAVAISAVSWRNHKIAR